MDPIDKILLGAGVVILLAIAICIFWLALSNAHLKTQLAQVQANATACHLANDDFAAQALRQNKAIADLKTESAVHALEEKQALLKADRQARAYLAAASRIAKTKAQGDACKAAGRLIDHYLGQK